MLIIIMKIYLLSTKTIFFICRANFRLLRCISFPHSIHQVYFVVSPTVNQRIKRLLSLFFKKLHVVTLTKSHKNVHKDFSTYLSSFINMLFFNNR